MFGLCWALAPVPLLFRCCFWWRNANFVVLVLSGWCSAWICPHLKETTVFLVEFLSQLTCIYQFQDRVLERYRPYQRKNKSVTPPQTGSLARRAMEEWERSICENQAFANLRCMQTGRSTLIKKGGGEMLVAMALDLWQMHRRLSATHPSSLKKSYKLCRTSNRTQLSREWSKPMCEMTCPPLSLH